MSHSYRAYGLTISSDVELHLQRHTGQPPSEADLVVEHAPGRAAQLPLAGRVVLDHSRDGRRWYQCTESADGSLTLRFEGVCDMEVAPDGRHVLVRVAPQATDGVATVLVAGALLALVLTVRGDLVLHGSAVDVTSARASTTIGFVGRSGMGKSTMAALVCRAGGSLVTDDILVLDRSPSGHVPRYGAPEVRLRDRAATLADELEGGGSPLRRSGDARHAVHLASSRAAQDVAGPAPALGALVIPFPDRTHAELQLQRLSAREAALTLMRFPRLSEWRDHAVTARHFADLVTLTSRVPVLLARVPWGPPFRPDVVDDLVARIVAADLPEPAPLVGPRDTDSPSSPQGVPDQPSGKYAPA